MRLYDRTVATYASPDRKFSVEVDVVAGETQKTFSLFHQPHSIESEMDDSQGATREVFPADRISTLTLKELRSLLAVVDEAVGEAGSGGILGEIAAVKHHGCTVANPSFGERVHAIVTALYGSASSREGFVEAAGMCLAAIEAEDRG